VLFTFPSRYWSTIGRQAYLALDGGPPSFPHERPSTWYSGTRPGVGSLSRTGLSPSLAGLSRPLLLAIPICNSLQESQLPPVSPTTPRSQRLRPIARSRFGLLRFRSPLLTESFLFLEVLRCFSSLGVPRTAYGFSRRFPGVTPGGFPHSETSGSQLARSSPERFVACHVLLRRLAPRHPPRALSSLTYRSRG
jgi:hypothetical protein